MTRVLPRPASFAASLPLIRVREMISIAQERRRLRHLEDWQLADLGLTRKEAETEAARPFWDLTCQ